ncbi:MAG: cation-transporting P-type ATPase [Oscillospiraceae bacterium]|nr:cation-transporting P-type ATPase [Oscillospiraceae bacterium]
MAQFFNFKEDYYGLTSDDVKKRLLTYGANIYSKNVKKEGFSYIKTILSPSVIIMLAAGILAFFGIGIAAGIVTILIDGLYCAAEIYFRKSAEKRLCELSDTFKMKMRVIRGGKVELVDKEDIVPEDLIVVQEGERVPADAFILESQNLTCDESIFTGTNAPAAKYSGGISSSEFKPTFVYAQTTVLSGIAICKVSATGVDTKYYQYNGEIPERSPYYTGIERIIRSLIPISSIVALIITILTLVVGLLGNGGFAVTAVSGLTLGLCFIPTGIESVIRFHYANGCAELLKHGAVIKSYNDIERLNSLSVICVEKEGAISKNNLEVRDIYAPSEELLYKVAALACDPNAMSLAERALMVKASFAYEKFSDIYARCEFIEKLPDDDMISGALWDISGERMYCIKGVPEQILPMCRLSGEKLIAAQKRYQEYYEKGCSVIAFACVEADSAELDRTIGFSYTFVGFASFSAPLRDSVSTAVKTCQNAGVRVVMLCEDSVDSAAATAKMIGIPAKNAVTGNQLENKENIDYSGNIFANITSEQKRQIIKQLRSDGTVVGMVGTRATDTEALRTADIGFTIADHCSPSVREAADIVMTDDNFLSIARSLAAARQVHRNIKRGVSLIISEYIGFLIIMIWNLIVDAQLMLNPPIMALFTMILLPIFAVSYAGGKTDMNSPMPSSDFISHRKFNLRYLLFCGIIGLIIGISVSVSYALMYNNTVVDIDQGSARSCGFITLMICTAAFAFIRYSERKPLKAFLKSSLFSKILFAAVVVFSVVFVYIPGVNSAFGLLPIDVFAVIISFLIGAIPPAAYFGLKYFLRIKE